MSWNSSGSGDHEPSVELAKSGPSRWMARSTVRTTHQYYLESGTSATASASSRRVGGVRSGGGAVQVDTGLIYDDAVELWNRFQDRYMGPFTEAKIRQPAGRVVLHQRLQHVRLERVRVADRWHRRHLNVRGV